VAVIKKPIPTVATPQSRVLQIGRKAPVMNKKRNNNSQWLLTIGLLLTTRLITYLTKIWFLLLLFPFGIFTFRKK
jgi:hypothetical protein